MRLPLMLSLLMALSACGAPAGDDGHRRPLSGAYVGGTAGVSQTGDR